MGGVVKLLFGNIMDVNIGESLWGNIDYLVVFIVLWIFIGVDFFEVLVCFFVYEYE